VACWSGLGVMLDGGKTKALGTASRRGRRLPGDALIELEVGLGLAEEVPVRHRPGSILPGGRTAGGRDRRRTRRLTDVGKNLLDGRGLGDEGDDAHVRAAVGTDQRQRLEQRLCQEFEIPYQRDVFRYYRSDSASAVEAGADLRTALATFGVDGSHGWERIHWHALESLARLVTVYMQGLHDTIPTTKRSTATQSGSRFGAPTTPSTVSHSRSLAPSRIKASSSSL